MRWAMGSLIQVGQRIAVAAVHGSWAEYFIAPAHGIIPLNNEIDDETQHS